MTFESGSEKESRKTKKGCIIVCAIVFIVIAVIILTLCLTVFRQRDPKVSVNSNGLANFDIFSSKPTEPLPMTITIKNPNYGDFYYNRASGFLHFHEAQVAEAPIEPGKVPARTTVDVNAVAAVQTQKITTHPSFPDDLGAGGLKFTATAMLTGKVVAMNIIKVKAKVNIFCDVFLNITAAPMELVSDCKTKIIV